MIDKGQWGEFDQDTRVTPLVFTRSAMGFLMTTESQDLGSQGRSVIVSLWAFFTNFIIYSHCLEKY